MKYLEVYFRKGHFYNRASDKQIHLKEGEMFLIASDDANFLDKNVVSKDFKALSGQEKLETLTAKYPGYMLKKILDIGQELCFKFGTSVGHELDKRRQFVFNTILLEDLYLKSLDGKKWNACECLSISNKCLSGEIAHFDPLIKESLNKLYTTLLTNYFPNQRAPSCNIFTTFYLINAMPTLTNYQFNLDALRKNLSNKTESF